MRLSRFLLGFPDSWEATATKAFAFHKVLRPSDSLTLEHLRELSARRDAVASKLVYVEGNPDAGAEEHRRQNYTHWVHQYTALLERFIQQAPELLDEKSAKKLVFQWNSPFAEQPNRFFSCPHLQMERAMVLYLYGAALRQQAYHMAATAASPTPVEGGPEGVAPQAQAATLLRKAAGIYTFLSDCVLPSIAEDLPSDRPSELTVSAASCLSFCCLAEAQAVTVHRATEKGTSPQLIVQLHAGASELMESASAVLRKGTSEHNQVSSRLRRHIAVASTFHEALAYMHFGRHQLANSQAGVAVGMCDHALKLLQKCSNAAEGDTRWLDVIMEAVNAVNSLRGHFDSERSLVYFQSIPTSLPTLPGGRVVVKPLDFEPPCDESSLFV